MDWWIDLWAFHKPKTEGTRALFNAFGEKLERWRVARWGGLRCGVWRDDIGGEHVTRMLEIPISTGFWLRSSTTIRSRQPFRDGVRLMFGS